MAELRFFHGKGDFTRSRPAPFLTDRAFIRSLWRTRTSNPRVMDGMRNLNHAAAVQLHCLCCKDHPIISFWNSRIARWSFMLTVLVRLPQSQYSLPSSHLRWEYDMSWFNRNINCFMESSFWPLSCFFYLTFYTFRCGNGLFSSDSGKRQ